MDFLKIFQKHKKEEHTVDTTKPLGGTGSIPKLGKQPGIPAMPKIEAPQNLPRIKAPSPQAKQASKNILNPNSEKT